MSYTAMSVAARAAEKEKCLAAYRAFASRGLRLDLSRGKPAADQLALSMPMLAQDAVTAENGFDCRNYGVLEGLPEMRRLFAELTGLPASYIVAAGNSSLNLMYDTVTRCMLYGTADSPRPWCREEKIRFLCPVPGYDRHFRICESLGIEMIPVEMDENGPVMDAVEEWVKDPTVRGIWCVPKYSNPSGITYSPETVARLGAMKTAAPDFRIFWDNAYLIHDLYDESDELSDIFSAARAAGNESRVFYFTSTSKVTFPGAGVAMMAMCEENMRWLLPILGTQTIGPDKLNQLRHVAYLRDRKNTLALMKRQAACIRPKFEALLDALERDLAPTGMASWTRPRGGYFISLDLPDGCAARTYELAREAGVTLTPAGATYPYGRDVRDRNLRLAPTYATMEEVAAAGELLTLAARIAILEKLEQDAK